MSGSTFSDTIYALSTPPGRGGVAVVRVSGPHAWEGLKDLTPGQKLPGVRQAVLRRIVAPETGYLIDQAMVIGFRAPRSFTGEDTVEYHLHGGVAVVRALMAALSNRPGHRLAAPGEFTRRAFENGKMDLTAAEGIADLIDAETEFQRTQALAQMEGALFRLYEGWTDKLSRILALMEADLDFSDQDLPDDLLLKVKPDLSSLISDLRRHLDDGHRGERLRDGIHLVVLGRPNAGKSSLVNALARRDVAIVSPLAGTTRDIIEVHLDLGGYPVIVSDTAGLRPEQLGEKGHDAIESEGIRRALERARHADLKLLVLDGEDLPNADPHTLALMDENSLIVLNKCDEIKGEEPAIAAPIGIPVVQVSARTGKGIDDLLQAVTARLADLAGQRGTPFLTRARHRDAVRDALFALERSIAAPLPELAAEDMRLALRFLGTITGRVDAEHLLDLIFRDFCIGK
jgi:tRNA modification GTPase